jgi:hypothetical protein
MKKLYIILTAGLLCGIVYAAQDTAISNREVRDPHRLEVWLEANASDTETRVASLEGGSTVGSVEPGYVIVGNASTAGVDVAISGDISIDTNGAVAIASGVIVNADVNASAAIVGSKLDLTSGTGAATLSGTLTAEQDVTLADTNNVARTLQVSNDFKWVVTANDIGSVTNGQDLSIVSKYYLIQAAGAVTCTVANASAIGAEFTIINTSAQAITFSDSGNLKLSSDAVLNQYDTLSLYAVAVDAWVEVGQQDN